MTLVVLGFTGSKTSLFNLNIHKDRLFSTSTRYVYLELNNVILCYVLIYNKFCINTTLNYVITCYVSRQGQSTHAFSL